MSYKIGSFNMLKFQAYRSDDSMKKDLDKISDIILCEQFDIVAMQEILSKISMDLVLRRLGNDWEGSWESPNTISVQAAEGYAFIWNKRRIQLAESLTVSGKRVFYPRIYNQYRIDRAGGQQELIRNPYYARFKPVNGFFEIRLINTHIMFTNSKSVNEEENTISLSDACMRKNEFDILVRNIYAKEDEKRYGNNMPAYTILLGDYNLNLNRTWTKGPYLEEVIEIHDGNRTKRVITVQDQLTTLGNRSRLKPDEPVCEYANNYDHFSYNENRFSDIDARCQKIDSVKKYCGDDFEKHKKEISDHVPISLEISLK